MGYLGECAVEAGDAGGPDAAPDAGDAGGAEGVGVGDVGDVEYAGDAGDAGGGSLGVGDAGVAGGAEDAEDGGAPGPLTRVGARKDPGALLLLYALLRDETNPFDSCGAAVLLRAGRADVRVAGRKAVGWSFVACTASVPASCAPPLRERPPEEWNGCS